MKEEQLLEIKSKIIQSMEPLLPEMAVDARTKFDILMQRMQFSEEQDIDLYNQAYEAAQSADAPQDRFDMLSELLREVNVTLIMGRQAKNDTEDATVE